MLYFFEWKFIYENELHKVYTAAHNLEEAQMIFVNNILNILKCDLDSEVTLMSEERVREYGLTALEPGIIFRN